jgi:hypothetical protein
MSSSAIQSLYGTQNCLGVNNPQETFTDSELITQPCGEGEQDWSYDKTNHYIKNDGWENACLTEDGAGNLVTLEECTGVSNQQWYYDSELKQIVNSGSDNCLAVDVDVFEGSPNIITKPCQFEKTNDVDNMQTAIFEQSGAVTATDPCDETCKKSRKQFIILLSLVLTFGVLALGGLGVTTYVLIKNAATKRQ